MNRLHVLLVLYRQSVSFTLFCSLALWWAVRCPRLSELPYYLPPLFWGRIIVQSGGWMLYRSLYRSRDVFGYHFGFTPLRVALSIFGIDSLLLLLCIALFSLLRS